MVVKHPNALVGTAGGAGLGPAVVEVLALFDVEVSGTLGAVIGGAAAGIVLMVGRKGVRGIARTVWAGNSNT